jgi:hypothetical protein
MRFNGSRARERSPECLTISPGRNSGYWADRCNLYVKGDPLCATATADERRNLELAPIAQGILEGGDEWPADHLEAPLVGALYAFLLAEADDIFTGRWKNDRHCIDLDEVIGEADLP